MVDGQEFETEGELFEMVGTKTYRASPLIGSQNFFRLRPFDKTPFDEWRKTNPIKKESHSKATGKRQPKRGRPVE